MERSRSSATRRRRSSGRRSTRLIPARFREAHRQHVERFASGDATARRMGERRTTIAGLRKNGEEFPAEAAISKLQVGDKTILTVALRDITERTRIEKEQRFLAEAGAVLAASLDYEQTLATVAHLVVRDFADWCIVEVVEEHEQAQAAKSRQPRTRPRPTFARSWSACRSIETALISDPGGRRDETVSPHRTRHTRALESAAQGPEHQRVLRAVNPTSLMAVPLLRPWTAPRRARVRLLRRVSPVRAERSSSGRGAGGASGRRHRECPSLQCVGPGGPGPGSGARVRRS